MLFADKGFQGTSTRDVAQKARVSETTLFRLFKHKQDLYLQVLDQNMTARSAERLLPNPQSSDDLEVFVSVAERLEELFDPIFLRLLFYAALERPDLFRKRCLPSLISLYELLATHIRARIASQILRDIDPVLMSRAFVGMIAYHRILCELLNDADSSGCDVEGAAHVYTDIWLRGALAWGTPARQNRTESTLVQPNFSARDGEQSKT